MVEPPSEVSVENEEPHVSEPSTKSIEDNMKDEQSYLKVGDISISSKTASVMELSNLVLNLLAQEEIRSYLLAFQSKKLVSGTYFG